MLKYVALSVCLCLAAMGLNRVLANQKSVQHTTQKSAHSVTNGSKTPAKPEK
jgi:hypothetical protein